jgi:hypothetical protein
LVKVLSTLAHLVFPCEIETALVRLVDDRLIGQTRSADIYPVLDYFYMRLLGLTLLMIVDGINLALLQVLTEQFIDFVILSYFAKKVTDQFFTVHQLLY